MRYNNISLIISSIKTDLSEYNIKILNLFEFLNPNLSNFINLSEEQKNNNENNIRQIKSVRPSILEMPECSAKTSRSSDATIIIEP